MIFHKPALLQETLEYLRPKASGLYIDATAGGGGHTKAILESGAKVLAIDRDPEAIEYLRKEYQQTLDNSQMLTLARGNFSQIGKIAKEHEFDSVDGILFDLGVSSHQLSVAARGFSIYRDGPLDMRMDPALNIKAENLVNDFDERRLYEIFKTYGQEKYSRFIARAIISARQVAPIKSTGQLAGLVEKTVYRSVRSRSRIHSATRVFQALRIVVNAEILNLEECLPQTVNLLKSGGRLVVISFHSLEDGIVKRFFKETRELKVLTERPIGPAAKELQENPRVRSAKLRAAEKVSD